MNFRKNNKKTDESFFFLYLHNFGNRSEQFIYLFIFWAKSFFFLVFSLSFSRFIFIFIKNLFIYSINLCEARIKTSRVQIKMIRFD